MDNPNAIHDTVWSWLSSSIRVNPSNAFTWVASAFNLLSATVYYAFYLLKYSLKCCFLLPYYAIKSYRCVGRTFLSVVKRAPPLIFAATLFIGLLGCILLDIPPAMRADNDRGRVVYLKVRQRGMRTLRSMRTNQPMGQRIAPSVTIRNVIEKLVESGAVDEEIVTAYLSGRENMEGRGNDADAQPQMRDRRGGIDGWLGVGALRRPNGEGGALDQLEALLDEANEMNERLRALWMRRRIRIRRRCSDFWGEGGVAAAG